jgi:hypothetical protein
MIWTVIVCGSRDGVPGAPWGWIGRALDAWEREHGNVDHVIQGGARGVDLAASEWALEGCRVCTNYPANWSVNGKGAGPIRNWAMLGLMKRIAPSDGRAVLAFPGGAGTDNMVRIARESGEVVWRCALVGAAGWRWSEAP